MDIKTLRAKGLALIEAHPLLRAQINDMYVLAVEEIREGGDPTHECELAWGAMEDIVHEHIANEVVQKKIT